MEMAVRAREQALLPVYRQMATTFAQMHDSPVRMVAKGVLRGIVPWHQARPFLTARLRRRCVPSLVVLIVLVLIAAQVSTKPAPSTQPACAEGAYQVILILVVHVSTCPYGVYNMHWVNCLLQYVLVAAQASKSLLRLHAPLGS